MNKKWLIVGLCTTLLYSSSACTKRVLVQPESEDIKKAESVGVMTKTGAELQLSNVSVSEDSLFGTTGTEPTALHLDEISAIYVTRPDYRSVVYPAVGIMVGVLVWAYTLRKIDDNEPLLD